MCPVVHHLLNSLVSYKCGLWNKTKIGIYNLNLIPNGCSLKFYPDLVTKNHKNIF